MAIRNQTPRPPTSKANIWSHATKNSRRANRRVDLFPYIAPFLRFLFFSLTISRPLPRLPVSPVPSSRCPSFYPKMTAISQVKCTRGLVRCLSAYVFLFSRKSPLPVVPPSIHGLVSSRVFTDYYECFALPVSRAINSLPIGGVQPSKIGTNRRRSS